MLNVNTDMQHLLQSQWLDRWIVVKWLRFLSMQTVAI